MCVLFVELAWRVACHRPSHWDVVEPLCLTHFIEVSQSFIKSHFYAFEIAALIHGAVEPAFLAGTVVTHENHDGVVELPNAFECVEETANLFVGVGQHCRVGRIETNKHFLFVGS